MGIFSLQNIVQLTFSGRKTLTPYGKENIYPVRSGGGSRKSKVESWKSEDPPRFSQNECTRSLKFKF